MARKYDGQDITVSYEPHRCLHVAECIRGLPAVFNTFERPWVQPENGTADEIAAVVLKCPTGALHYERTDDGAQEIPAATNTVFVTRNGPYYVRGDLEIVMPDGEILHETRAALCRCGGSASKPFCDNTHRANGFADAAAREPDANAAQTELPVGQKLRITPQPNGSLRFEGPFEIHDLRAHSEMAAVRTRFADGALIYRGDKEWLCRCGGSGNKPFCDSTHKRIGFRTEVQEQRET